jgi:DNA-binding FrmR family transcriptional regulator
MADKHVEKSTSDRVKARLKRLEGQMRGVASMIDDGRSCEDIITQLSAISSGITSAAREVLFGHIEHHVVEGIKRGDEQQMVEGLKSAVESFAKLK